jgi:hypothetical protein
LRSWKSSWRERIEICRDGLRLVSNQKEVSLNWNISIRQIHRWLSIAFTVAVIVNVVAMMQEKQVVWVGLLALFPLILLLVTGLYMFALPYAVKWRSERGISG